MLVRFVVTLKVYGYVLICVLVIIIQIRSLSVRGKYLIVKSTDNFSTPINELEYFDYFRVMIKMLQFSNDEPCVKMVTYNSDKLW